MIRFTSSSRSTPYWVASQVAPETWLGALLVAAGELPDPFPPPIEELARYFEAYPPEVKA